MKKIWNLTIIFTLLALVSVSTSCNKDNDDEELMRQEAEALENYLDDNNITTEPETSGLYYIETTTGTGDFPQAGQEVSVHYTGKLINGTEFDSSIGGQPFSFPLGMGYVIPGWDEGIALMKKGGKATLIIPSSLAYGASGAGQGAIPPYSTLVFDVELVDIGL